jgi:predicted small secreted protein
MKRFLSIVTLSICICFLLSSCATVFGGRVSDVQRTKPKVGEPSRAIRGGALIADIFLFWPGTIVDFATGAIYKPAKK